MRKFFTASLVLLFAFAVHGQDSIKKFRYQPEKITTGLVYHYLKTNIDGSRPENVSQYVAANDRLEVLKFHERGERAGLVIAEMDWSTFSVRRLESWQVFAGAERRKFATLKFLPGERAVEISIPLLRTASEKTAIKHLPFHVYNFDFGSLNFAFRHLIDPRASFVIGVADPTFKDEGPLFAYRGEATVTYVKDEKRDGVLCRKYRVDGPGLANRGGFIWVDKSLGHVQDMEIDLPDNPDWQNFKFKLVRTEKMSAAEWDAFIKKQMTKDASSGDR